MRLSGLAVAVAVSLAGTTAAGCGDSGNGDQRAAVARAATSLVRDATSGDVAAVCDRVTDDLRDHLETLADRASQFLEGEPKTCEAGLQIAAFAVPTDRLVTDPDSFPASDVTITGSTATLRPSRPTFPLNGPATFERSGGDWKLGAAELLSPSALKRAPANRVPEDLASACQLGTLLERIRTDLAASLTRAVDVDEEIATGALYIEVLGPGTATTADGAGCSATVETRDRRLVFYDQASAGYWSPGQRGAQRTMPAGEIRVRNIVATASGPAPIELGGTGASAPSPAPSGETGSVEPEADESKPAKPDNGAPNSDCGTTQVHVNGKTVEVQVTGSGGPCGEIIQRAVSYVENGTLPPGWSSHDCAGSRPACTRGNESFAAEPTGPGAP